MRALPADTTRLRFRPYEYDDFAVVKAIFDDEAARRFYPGMADDDAIAAWIADNHQRYCDDGFGLWAVVEKSSDVLIGDCGLTYQNVEGEQLLELGYHIRADRRGNGFALEAARSALKFGLERVEDLVCSIVAPDNTASIAVASKLHSKKRNYLNRRDEPRLLYYTRAKDWERRNARLDGDLGYP